ncbi:hypothetical protein Q7P37_000018 [Cladosporium fusiforme]
MFRSALRTGASSRLTRSLPQNATAKRFLTTAPPHKTSRSWKNSAARWTLAGALIYYYNTSNVFAEEPVYTVHSPPATSRETETYPTIDSIAEKRRQQARSQSQAPSSTPTDSTPEAEPAAAGSPEQLEQEAGQQGAFNEETGEINWDCPCLGGMAYGPCGEQFREAFSCFVFSQDEPKGIDCIDKFKGMQDCFREHPDVYGAELEDADTPLEDEQIPAEGQAAASAPHEGGEKVSKPYGSESPEAVAGKQERSKQASKEVKQQSALTETDEAVPKAWHNDTSK